MKCEIMNLKEIKNIGFIGLGVMGSPMCKNLVKNKQWHIIVHDLDNSKEKELEKNGASIAKNLNELFNVADMIITCLPGGDFVKEIYFGEKKIVSEINPDKLIIDMSTSQPDLMIELNKLITKKGSFFADAPIARTIMCHCLFLSRFLHIGLPITPKPTKPIFLITFKFIISHFIC